MGGERARRPRPRSAVDLERAVAALTDALVDGAARDPALLVEDLALRCDGAAADREPRAVSPVCDPPTGCVPDPRAIGVVYRPRARGERHQPDGDETTRSIGPDRIAAPRGPLITGPCCCGIAGSGRSEALARRMAARARARRARRSPVHPHARPAPLARAREAARGPVRGAVDRHLRDARRAPAARARRPTPASIPSSRRSAPPTASRCCSSGSTSCRCAATRSAATRPACSRGCSSASTRSRRRG